MMQKLSAAITAVAPLSKSNGVDGQPNANAEVAQAPHAFQTLLKKQTQSNQQASQKPAVAEHKATTQNLRQAPQVETQKTTEPVMSTKAHEKEGAQSMATSTVIDTQQQKNESLAAKVADEMVALLSVPAEVKPAQVENAIAVEPSPENTLAAEQTTAALLGTVITGNGMLNKPESAQPITQTASNTQSQAVGATGLLATPSKTLSATVDASANNATLPIPEQSAFATQLNEAKMPMVASQENTAESVSAKAEIDKPLNVATAMTGLQNNSQATAATPMPAAPQQVVASNMIEAKLGNTGWNQAISQRVIWMAGAGEQSATLTLNPPDLGPLQVVVQVHNGLADTTFTSDNADVRQALQDGMEHLREKMRESGVQLGQTNVQSGEQSQKTFEQATQHRPSQHRAASSSVADDIATQQKPIIRVANGLVDTFA